MGRQQAGGAAVHGDYILIRDVKTNGSHGGTFTASAWQTRDLTEITADVGGHASLASNQVTLQPGTYRFNARAPGFMVNRQQTRLYDITGTATIELGSNATAKNADEGTDSKCVGEFTITAATVFELQHYCTITRATNGFGATNGSTVENVYSTIEFWKVG